MLSDSTNCPRCHNPLFAVPCGQYIVCSRCGQEIHYIPEDDPDLERYGKFD